MGVFTVSLLDEAEKFFANLNKGRDLKQLTMKERRALRKTAIAVSNAANRAEKAVAKPRQNAYTRERQKPIETVEVPKYDTFVNLTDHQLDMYTEYKKFASPMRKYDVEKLLVKANKSLSSKERESLVDEYEYYGWHYGS